jgi:hypothetical protein
VAGARATSASAVSDDPTDTAALLGIFEFRRPLPASGVPHAALPGAAGKGGMVDGREGQTVIASGALGDCALRPLWTGCGASRKKVNEYAAEGCVRSEPLYNGKTRVYGDGRCATSGRSSTVVERLLRRYPAAV